MNEIKNKLYQNEQNLIDYFDDLSNYRIESSHDTNVVLT